MPADIYVTVQDAASEMAKFSTNISGRTRQIREVYTSAANY